MDYAPEGQKRGPGRPSNAEIAARTATRADTVKRERRRRADTSETADLKLAVPEHLKEPGFTYRWINDTAGGRIMNKTTTDDWDVVKDMRIDGEGEGTPVTRNVGTGEHGKPLRAVLCKKPLEWHQEDQARKAAPRLEMEETMKRGPLPNSNGISAAEAYVPAGHSNSIGRGS